MRASWLISIPALALLLSAGCGSSSSSGPNADSFVGMWTFGVGSIDPQCSGIAAGAIDLTGDMVDITKTDSTHIAVSIGGGMTGAPVMCDVNFTVNGYTATAAAGQTCAINDSGTTATVQITSWTMILSPALNSISMDMMGTANVVIVSCTPTSTGTLERSGTDAG